MNRVYIVTSGQYSSYGINAVFSTRKKAEEWIGARPDYNIEEWWLDAVDEDVRVTVVGMEADGEVLTTYTDEPYCISGGRGTGADEAGFHGFFESRSGAMQLYWGVRTSDEAHAIKVVNEQRQWILAHDLWGNSAGVQAMLQGASEVPIFTAEIAENAEI